MECMKYLLFTLFFTNIAYSKQLRVAVIDTGIQKAYTKQANLCKSGHKSFAKDKSVVDTHGHGTNIAGLIKNKAGKSKYCIIVIRFYSNGAGDLSKAFIRSLEYAYILKPDILNLSGGGLFSDKRERLIIKRILDKGIIVNAAAGNESLNLDNNCLYYPACYDKRINVIGAKNVPQSNYGKIVDYTINGKDRKAFGITLSGTSQSTAIFTGLMIKAFGMYGVY
jgi:major intracellular serine protease